MNSEQHRMTYGTIDFQHEDWFTREAGTDAGQSEQRRRIKYAVNLHAYLSQKPFSSTDE